MDCTVLGTGSMPDAEDSSYDSDYEAEDATAATATTTATAMTATAAGRRPRPESQVTPVHSDVSRTTSDTLAAEFAEYVTIQGPPPTQSPGRFLRLLLLSPLRATNEKNPTRGVLGQQDVFNDRQISANSETLSEVAL